MDREKSIAMAAHAFAAKNVATAVARFGYVAPAKSTAHVAAPAVPSEPTAEQRAAREAEVIRQSAARQAELKAAEAAETKASWQRVVAQANKQAGLATDSEPRPMDAEPATGWSKVVSKLNQSINPKH